MNIELTKEELEIIEGWYLSAAGESASGLELGHITEYRKEHHSEYQARLERARLIKDLVDRLGFEYHDEDAYQMKKIGLLDQSWKGRDEEDDE